MDLVKFDNKTQLLINAAFNNATEKRFAFFGPLHILEILLQGDEPIDQLLEYFKLDRNQKHKDDFLNFITRLIDILEKNQVPIFDARCP